MQGKSEILHIKNLLKPVKLRENPVIRAEHEFEHVKLRKTETTNDKLQEKSLHSNSDTENKIHEFSGVVLRKTNSVQQVDLVVEDRKKKRDKEASLGRAAVSGSMSQLEKESPDEESGDITDTVRDNTNHNEAGSNSRATGDNFKESLSTAGENKETSLDTDSGTLNDKLQSSRDKSRSCNSGKIYFNKIFYFKILALISCREKLERGEEGSAEAGPVQDLCFLCNNLFSSDAGSTGEGCSV